MPTLNQLTLDADGTIDTSNIIDSDTDGTYFDDCNDAPDGVSTDYIEHNAGLSDGTYTAWFSLTNVNSDFGRMDTLNIDVDLELIGISANDESTLQARIFDADNDTSNPLTAEIVTLGDESDETRVQRNVAFASLAGTKAQWDSAFIRFSFVYNRISGPDSFTLRFYGCDIDGTYSTLAPVWRDRVARFRAHIRQ